MNSRCPRCRKESPRLLSTRDLNRRITKTQFDYYRCPTCELVFLWPVPEDLGRYYPKNYYNIPSTADALDTAAALEKYKIEIVTRFSSRGKLLEIGPAYGSFTYLAKQAGFEVDAIEMDPDCCRFMRDIVGINAIHSADIQTALRNTGAYEVIALWHVIEHLPDPWSVLEAIVEHLSPGGLLVVAAPNPEALQFRLFGRCWTHLDAPRHLFLIPPAILTEQVMASGLSPLLVTTRDAGSISWDAFGWEMTLANVSTNRYIRKAIRLLGGLVGKIAAPAEKAEGRGSAYTAVYRKREHP